MNWRQALCERVLRFLLPVRPFDRPPLSAEEIIMRVAVALLILIGLFSLLSLACGCVVKVEPTRPRPGPRPPLVRPVPITIPVPRQPHRDHWRETAPAK